MGVPFRVWWHRDQSATQRHKEELIVGGLLDGSGHGEPVNEVRRLKVSIGYIRTLQDAP